MTLMRPIETETETYVDPITGMVTTVERPKKKKPPVPTASPRSSQDLSSRLAAVMADKKPSTSPSPSIKTESLETETKKDTTDIPSEPTPSSDEKKELDTQPPADPSDESETTVEKPIEIEDKKRQMDRILEQRETQLFQAMETIAKLHDQIHQMQEETDQKQTLIQQLETEKDQLAQENSQAGSAPQLMKSVKRLESTVEDLKRQLADKDDKLQGLLQEGEKLSKAELKHTTTIKKLRGEKSEAEKSVNELTKKLEKAQADLALSAEKETKLTEQEKKLQASVKLLNDLTEQQTRHINKLESEKQQLTKKLSETEVALKTATDSIEQEKQKAQIEAEQVNAAALEKEIKANDRLHKELTKQQQDAELLEAKLRKEVRELQIALQAVEEQAGTREDQLRKEVADLQLRLQLSDTKMDDLTVHVDEATAPLLRQIEQLQTQHAIAIKSRDEAEQRYRKEIDKKSILMTFITLE